MLLLQYQEKPWLYPEDIAQLKAEDIVKQVLKNGGDNDQPIIVIGCDTVVTLNNKFYGKPKDVEDAKATLKGFSDQNQKVYSGVCIYKGTVFRPENLTM